MAELEEGKCKLANLKSQRDASLGARLPNLHLGNRNGLDKYEDKSRKLRELETALEEQKVLVNLLRCFTLFITIIY